MPRLNPPTGDPILDALRRERERRGWSQRRMANEIGRATYQGIFEWESGRHDPTLNNLRHWAAALGFVLTLEPLPAEQPEPDCGALFNDPLGRPQPPCSRPSGHLDDATQADPDYHSNGMFKWTEPARDPDACPTSTRVDGPRHSWRWDGDDPRTVCVFCGQMRDALSGAVIREGAAEQPEDGAR